MACAAPVSHRVTTTRLALGLLVLAQAAPPAAALTPHAFAARVVSARNDSGANPQRAFAALRALRTEAVARNALDQRLLVDEAECRVLTDFDATTAIAVADAGLALAGANPASPAREAWLRLRACRAGMWMEAGNVAGGCAEFERLIELASAEAHASVRARVRAERGPHRSRSGDWTGDHQDLLAACNTLRDTGPARDHELCLGLLANHYKRIGDADEALRLLQSLSTEARHRGAVHDDSICTFGIGQVLHEQQRRDDAITKFGEAIQANRRLGDDTGIAYAEHAIATSLRRLGRPQDALQVVERSLGRLDAKGDLREYQVATITRADAMRQLGRWQEADLALAEARRLDADLQRQRLSEQSARVRMQFNRARDAEELSALRQLNEQSQRLRHTQAVALALFVILLALLLVFAVRKFRQARHLQNLASTDELTGLANRRALLAYADDAIAQAQQAAERMRSAIAATPLIGPAGEVRFTVSIGVAAAQIAEAADALVARADAALYRAKNSGRNAVVADDGHGLRPGAT